MTDLHTHILPGMDDGAKHAEESLTMLRAEAAQGVDTVILTPHFYRDREPAERFLARRQRCAAALAEALKAMPKEERAALPRLALGAEVAWRPHLADWPELGQLCLGESHYFLLELPSWQWNDQLISQLYELQGHTGFTPVLAHLERYLKDQRPEHIEAVLSLGVPVQLSAGAFLRLFDRGKVLRLLRDRRAHLVASDAHDPERRPPNLGMAMDVIRSKLGVEKARSIAAHSDRLLVPAAGERQL